MVAAQVWNTSTPTTASASGYYDFLFGERESP
jgi:hypothetical protein